MRIKQLSLFIENKTGSVSSPCSVLAKANIDISTMTLADTQEFGILRLIIKEWETAKKILQDAGFVVNLTDVIAIEVEDRPGGLADILEILENNDVSLDYMYAFSCGERGKAVIVLRFEDTDKALDVLTKNNVSVLDKVTVFDKTKG